MAKKIIVIGNNNIAVKCLEELLRLGQKIVLVVADPETSSRKWQDSFKEFALSKNLPFAEFRNINDKDAVEQLKKLEPDFIFSFQYKQILKKPVIEIPKFGCINLHFSYLPKYRGCYPIAWALINGENYGGVTLHYISPGIDNGDIIAQKKVPISVEADARNLYDKYTEWGFLFFKETVPLIFQGKSGRASQDNSKSSYYSNKSIDFSKNKIEWQKGAFSLFNWIRAFIFPPFQLPYFEFNGKKFFVSKIGYEIAKTKKHGIVEKIDDAAVYVSALNGNVLIREIKTESGEILFPKEFALAENVSRGSVFY
jgi:methionyl-tRNA formyltransferase